jgi:hypothetical protein
MDAGLNGKQLADDTTLSDIHRHEIAGDSKTVGILHRHVRDKTEQVPQDS